MFADGCEIERTADIDESGNSIIAKLIGVTDRLKEVVTNSGECSCKAEVEQPIEVDELPKRILYKACGNLLCTSGRSIGPPQFER